MHIACRETHIRVYYLLHVLFPGPPPALFDPVHQSILSIYLSIFPPAHTKPLLTQGTRNLYQTCHALSPAQPASPAPLGSDD
jgi:hypothetical protein